jgi:hypothetical protein
MTRLLDVLTRDYAPQLTPAECDRLRQIVRTYDAENAARRVWGMDAIPQSDVFRKFFDRRRPA